MPNYVHLRLIPAIKTVQKYIILFCILRYFGVKLLLYFN